MTRLDEYRAALRALDDWTPYLEQHSGLPGPRGNLELAQAFAELADDARVEEVLATPPERAPENSPGVFLVFCGVTALGSRAAQGDARAFERLRAFASDPRWRVREAVATGLQYVGDANMPALLTEMQAWMAGNAYERRAAAAALCEPRLLKDARSAAHVLRLIDRLTKDMTSASMARDEAYKVLRQAMGYCWSVAVAASPEKGKALFEKWLASSDPDVRWIMTENLKKNRLVRIDDKWVQRCLRTLKATRR